jgi:hypothetical protein
MNIKFNHKSIIIIIDVYRHMLIVIEHHFAYD